MTFITVVPVKYGDEPPQLLVSLDEPRYRTLPEKIPQKGESFRLNWSGSKPDPAGAVVGSHTIGRIHDGSVFDTQGVCIGSYQWALYDPHGKAMLVTLFPDKENDE